MKRIACLSLLALMAAAGCESTSATGPEGKAVTITAPPSVTVQRGGSMPVNVAINRGGFADPVVVSITDLPSGVTVATPKVTVEGGSTTFTLIAAPTAPLVANHQARITASAGPNAVEVTHKLPVSVK